MSYGLFGTVGLPLRGWISVTEFIHAHHCEVEWHAGLEEGWVDGQWIDQSGVMVSARVHANGTVEAVPGALREARTLAARFGVVDGDNVMYADVVDADGERIGRFCADTAQHRDIALLDPETPTPVVVTGLCKSVSVHPDAAAFRTSPDSSMGQSGERRTMPDGTVTNELKVGLPSFFPVGMLTADPWQPTSLVNAVVESARTVTVNASGEQVVMATVEPLDGLGMTLCWPPDLAPQPRPGNVVHAKAYLTAFIPEVWRRVVTRSPQPARPPLDDQDVELTPLSIGRRHVLHLMFEHSLDAAGLPWCYDGGDYYDVDGRIRAGLAGIARIVANAPLAHWQGIVDERIGHIGEVLSSEDKAPTLDRLYPRLRVQQSNGQADYPLTGVIDGLEVLLAIDSPRSVSLVQDPRQLAPLGPLERLFAAAEENLAALPVPAPDPVEVEAGDRPLTIFAFEFDDYFGASRLLHVADLVREHIGPAPHGVVASIPDRQVLMIAVLDEGPALGTINTFASVTQGVYDSADGPVSREVYYQRDDNPAQPIAHLQDDDTVYVKVTEQLHVNQIFGGDE
ncbi:MAG: hypothetical protein EKK60_03970 [Gordonia sp. (in: high G+C Gram-positive bacteria)]|nr:MAG: hypothetical protein EKK60_03970 [Gordonia sp. (in: high G+C Gram-positive bacteria)]